MAQASAKAAAPAKKTLAHGVGRRKKSVARVWFKRGKGDIRINGLDILEYFDTKFDVETAETPCRVVPVSANYDMKVTVTGGGKTAQADAVKLAISRGLVSMDETIRPLLRENNLLTVDDRIKERKKPGQKAARRKFQFVKR